MTHPGLTQDQLDSMLKRFTYRRDTARRGGMFTTDMLDSEYRTTYADTLAAVIQTITDITNRTQIGGITGAGLEELKSFVNDELDQAKNNDNAAHVDACNWVRFIVRRTEVKANLDREADPIQGFVNELARRSAELNDGTEGDTVNMTPAYRYDCERAITEVLRQVEIHRTGRYTPIMLAETITEWVRDTMHIVGRRQRAIGQKPNDSARWNTLAWVSEVVENLVGELSPVDEPDQDNEPEGTAARDMDRIFELEKDLARARACASGLIDGIASLLQKTEARASEAAAIYASTSAPFAGGRIAILADVELALKGILAEGEPF